MGLQNMASKPNRSSSSSRKTNTTKALRASDSDDSSGGSEWEQSTGGAVDNEDDAGSSKQPDHEDELPHPVKSTEARINTAAKRPPWNKGLGKKRLRPHQYDTDNEDYFDQMPTYVRKTDRGGYAHTKKSRARIGKANKGKSPWNKGKQRSEEVKAKISAGVVARNQATLAKKLKILGMTETEWMAKQKEIRQLRDRVKRAKQAAIKRKEMAQVNLIKLEQELNDALASRPNMNEIILGDEEKVKLKEDEIKEEVSGANASNSSSDEEKKDDQPGQSATTQEAFFQKDIAWEPLEWHGTPKCPSGGPGGLICCDYCSAAFSKLLADTAKDAEVQTRHNVGKEVQELLGYLDENRFALMIAVQAARNDPLPPSVVEATSINKQLAISKRNEQDIWSEVEEWTMTSVMDLKTREEINTRI